MRVDVVAWYALNDADVRLRLRAVIEDDRALRLDEPAFAERPLQRLRHEEHRGPAPAVLRLLHEQQPVEELDRVVLAQKIVVDRRLVLESGPAMRAKPHRVIHGVK